jgi:Mrp family chromosome partitioning ATPase
MVLAFAMSGLVLAVAYLIANWSSYSAQCIVYIQPTSSAVLGPVAPEHWPYSYNSATFESYVQQQPLSVTRPDVLAGALRKLGPGVWLRRGESDQNAADRLKGAIEVARLGASYQISITARASNPETSAMLANAEAASYIEIMSHEQNVGDAKLLAMLGDERDRIKNELDADRAEQAALSANPGTAASGTSAQSHNDDQIAQIHEELVKARAEHDEAGARLISISAKNGLSSSTLDPAASAPGQDQLRADLDQAAATESRLNAQLAEMTRAATSATPKFERSRDLAGDITRLQNLFSAIDEQFQNQALENGPPGIARLAAAATAPLHPDEFKVISNAIVLLLVFVFLGVVAAIAAHRIDPRVCVASDVEKLLGIAPVAQLPDFSEVSEETADVHLLRLAAAFDYACVDGGMKSCIFTGTGPGVGVTTVATRVRDKLESIGRAAVLVDATGAAHEPFSAGDEKSDTEPPSQANPRPITLLQQVAGSGEMRRGELVFADTPPLAVSAETECLARFADCAIVVIESGVTTRAQLRRAASLLERLNLNAVGFVLNRVKLAKADSAFRNSVEEIEEHLRTQGRLTDWQTIRSRYFMAKLDRAATEPSVPADSAAANQHNMDDHSRRTAETKWAELADDAAPLPELQSEVDPPNWQPDAMPSWLTDALARVEAKNSTPYAQPAREQGRGMPADAETRRDESAAVKSPPVAEEETSNGTEGHSNISPSMLFNVAPEDLNRAAHPGSQAHDAVQPQERPANGQQSRLGSLRSVVSPESLKQLQQARLPEDYVSEAAPAAGKLASQPALQDRPGPGSSRLSRLRGFVSTAGLQGIGKPKQPAPIVRENSPGGQPVSAEEVSPQPALLKRPVPEQTQIPYAKPDSSLTGPGGNPQPIDVPQSLPKELELLRARLAAASPLDRRDTWDAVQILPSRRGQYRKND